MRGVEVINVWSQKSVKIKLVILVKIEVDAAKHTSFLVNGKPYVTEVTCGIKVEVERGEKEASSELLASICKALDLPLSRMLTDVADRVSLSEAAEQQLSTVLADGLAQPIRHPDTEAETKRRLISSAA